MDRDHKYSKVLYSLMLMLSVFMPFPIWFFSTKLNAQSHSGQAGELFGLEATFLALAIAAVGLLEARRRKFKSLYPALPMVLFLVNNFCLLFLWSNFSGTVSYDYGAYENHARIYVDANFVDPGGHGNIYPPTMSQSLAACYVGIKTALSLTHLNPDSKFIWNGVFYLYQSMQLMLMFLANLLCFRFLRSLKIDATRAALVTLLVLVCDYPMICNLQNNQTNLYVLDSVLLAMLYATDKPWLAGIALALGAHIKLYPAVLLLPLALLRNFRVIAWCLLTAAGVVFVLTKAGTDWSPWINYIHSVFEFKSAMTINPEVLNCNSLFAITANFALLLNKVFSLQLSANSEIVSIISKLAAIVVIVFFIYRIAKRSIQFHRFSAGNADQTDVAWWLKMTTYANCVDSMAMALLISPRVFEHQYVALLPLVLWTIATKGSSNPIKTAAGCCLLLIPLPATLTVFPILKYHWVWGIIVLSGLNRISYPVRTDTLVMTAEVSDTKLEQVTA